MFRDEKMKKIMTCALALVLSFALPGCVGHSTGSSGGGKNCKTGKPCGNTCIARDKTCRR